MTLCINKFKQRAKMDRKASKSEQNQHNLQFVWWVYMLYLKRPVSIRFLPNETKLSLPILGSGVRAIDRDTAPLSWGPLSLVMGPLSLVMKFAGANKHPLQEILTLLKKGVVAPDFALLSFQVAIAKYWYFKRTQDEYKELDLVFREIVRESDAITEKDYIRAKKEVLELMERGYEYMLFETKKFRPLVEAVEKKIFAKYED